MSRLSCKERKNEIYFQSTLTILCEDNAYLIDATHAGSFIAHV